MTVSPLFSPRDIEAVRSAAERIVKAANESLQFANTSTDQSQRYANFNIVRVNLERLKQLCSEYPFLNMTNLDAFEVSFEAVQNETKSLKLTKTSEYTQAKIAAVGSRDLFLDLSLRQQCQTLKIDLEVLVLERSSKQWVLDGRSFNRPEAAALAYYQGLGFVGTSCEGVAPLMIMKCSCLEYLKKVNLFKDPIDAAMRLFEAQCWIYSHLSRHIIEQIGQSSAETVLNNFQEIASIPRYAGIYPLIDANAIVAIWRAIGPKRLAALAELFMSDPYRHRSGWPDLTLARGAELRFVEIKTSDRLRGSQKALIEEILKPWNASVGVLQIRPPSASASRRSRGAR